MRFIVVSTVRSNLFGFVRKTWYKLSVVLFLCSFSMNVDFVFLGLMICMYVVYVLGEFFGVLNCLMGSIFVFFSFSSFVSGVSFAGVVSGFLCLLIGIVYWLFLISVIIFVLGLVFIVCGV